MSQDAAAVRRGASCHPVAHSRGSGSSGVPECAPPCGRAEPRVLAVHGPVAVSENQICTYFPVHHALIRF